MDDMADMLRGAAGTPAESPPPEELESKTSGGISKQIASSSKKKAPKGMSREVLALMSSDGNDAPNVVVPEVKKLKIDPSFKTRSWQWAGFHNSGRTDGFRLRHWMRKPIVVDDYTFARFNKPVYVVSYTDEQYESTLKDPVWSKEETDTLINLCRKFGCRWPIIADRWPSQMRPVTLIDLRERYFIIAKALVNKFSEEQMLGGNSVEPRLAKLSADARTALKNFTFDVEDEREKRMLADQQFIRTREGEAQLANVTAELQKLDAEIRKVKGERKRVEEKQRNAEKKIKKAKLIQAEAARKAANALATKQAPPKTSPPAAKKPKVERPDLPVEQLDQAVASIGAIPEQFVTEGWYRRSALCRPLKLTESGQGIEVTPPLSTNQTKSVALLLAKKEGDALIEVPSEAIATEVVSFRADCVRLVVLESAIKKKKADLKTARAQLRQLLPPKPVVPKPAVTTVSHAAPLGTDATDSQMTSTPATNEPSVSVNHSEEGLSSDQGVSDPLVITENTTNQVSAIEQEVSASDTTNTTHEPVSASAPGREVIDSTMPAPLNEQSVSKEGSEQVHGSAKMGNDT